MPDVRAAVSDEDRWYEETWQYFFFAERFGWTPEETDNCPLRIVDRLPGVAQMYDEVEADRQREQAESAKA